MAKKQRRSKRVKRSWQRFSLTGAVILACFVGLLINSGVKSAMRPSDPMLRKINADLRRDFQTLTKQLARFEDRQTASGLTVISDQLLQEKLTVIAINIEANNVHRARQEIWALTGETKSFEAQLNTEIAERNTARLSAAPTITYGLQVPILIYHHTPADFESQLQALIRKGYTTIGLDQLALALHGQGSLPSKPAVITFDDGFSDQMAAFELLKKYNMKATFYIITGGAASRWCLGANRTNTTCGDGYLNWDQIKQLDQSGLITIGNHTVDHANLPSLPLQTQRMEIMSAKNDIESQLSHPIYHFAYPYGAFGAATIGLVKEAGFMTAVSTIPGSVQTGSNIYSLHRVRDPYALP